MWWIIFSLNPSLSLQYLIPLQIPSIFYGDWYDISQKGLTVFFSKKKKVLYLCAINMCYWRRKNFPTRNFYLGKADYIFTLTFAAEVCLKVPTILLYNNQFSVRLSFMWGWGLCVVEVTLSRWSLCLRWCVSLQQSILPILAPVTCYTPSPSNKYLTWSICPKYLTWNICQMICSISNFLFLQDYVYDSFDSCPISL